MGHQPIPQPGIPLLGLVVFYSNRHRLLRPDENDKFLPSGDPGVE